MRRANKALDILSRASREKNLTVRDDQYDFPGLLDLVKAWRKSNRRVRVVDSGKIEAVQLEWLGEAGADIYTSDRARGNPEELELIHKACRRGRAITAYLLQGPLKEDEGEGPFFSDIVNLGKNGIYLYLSIRNTSLDFSMLRELASTAKKGGSWLVYYHHGPLEETLEELARSSAWIHLSDRSLKQPKDAEQVIELIKTSESRKPRFVIHVERRWDVRQLQDVLETGAYVLFKTALSDYRSPLRPLEEKSKKQKLDFRAYYLYPDFF